MSRDVSGKSPEKPKARKSEVHQPAQVQQTKKKPRKATATSLGSDVDNKPGESSKGTKKGMLICMYTSECSNSFVMSGTTRKPRNTSKKVAGKVADKETDEEAGSKTDKTAPTAIKSVKEPAEDEGATPHLTSPTSHADFLPRHEPAGKIKEDSKAKGGESRPV